MSTYQEMPVEQLSHLYEKEDNIGPDDEIEWQYEDDLYGDQSYRQDLQGTTDIGDGAEVDDDSAC